MNQEFWRGRRVLVTGHTGFKGAWLCTLLSRAGADVHGIALAPATDPSMFDVIGLRNAMHSHEGDIRDRERVNAVFSEARPEAVFHLAAQSLVRAGYADPIETYSTNVVGTATVLEVARKYPDIKAIVVATSDKCYENREWAWGYREIDRLGGRDPYSSSKAATELVVQAFQSSFDDLAPAATVRAGNVIGGGDWSSDRLVPDIVRAAGKGVRPVLRYPSSTRPWQHVLDALRGYVMLAEKLSEDRSFAGAYNFGPFEAGWPVAAVTEAILEAMGLDEGWDLEGAVQPHEAHSLRVDASRAHQLLEWYPKLDMRTTVEWTARWYERWSSGADAAEVTNQQIDEFWRR